MALNKIVIDKKRFTSELSNCFNSEDLRILYKHIVGRSAPTRKLDIAAALASTLDPPKLRELYERLSRDEKLVISEALYSEDGFEPNKFAAKYGTQVELYKRHSREPAYLQLFVTYEIFRQYRIRPILEPCMRTFVPKPAAPKIESASEVPKTLRVKTRHFRLADSDPARYLSYGKSTHVVQTEKPRTIERIVEIAVKVADRAELAQIELGAVLKAVQDGKIVVSEKTGLPSTDTLHKIRDIINGDYYQDYPPEDYAEIGPIRSYAWAVLLRGSSMVKQQGKKLTLNGSNAIADYANTFDMIRSIWKSWHDVDFDEFSRVDSIKGQNGKGRYSMSRPRLRREAIEKTLADCPAHEWINVDEFLRFLRASGNDFCVSFRPSSLYFYSAGYGGLGGYGGDGEQLLQEEYTLCFLMEYAATLGLIDIAFVHPQYPRRRFTGFWGTDDLSFVSRYDGLLYFRINELGEYCLGKKPQFKSRPRVEPRLQVLPSLRISLVEGSLSVGDRLVLDAFAENIDDGVWDLSREKSLVACEAGHDMQKLRELLTRLDDQELPDQVETFISQTIARSTSVRPSGNALLFTCKNADIAKEISGHSLMKNLCLLLGENQLVVKTADEQKFRKALRVIGYGCF